MMTEDEVLQYVQDLKNKKLNPQDKFRFKCRACGKCCRNRHDIILPPYDVYKISKYLNLSPEEMINQYCEWYIGPDSKLPIVRILPRGAGNVCPFMQNKLCTIHAVKPGVCALFPLGRAILHDESQSGNEILYFKQDVDCSVKKEYSLEEWLMRVGLHESEEYFLAWSQFTYLASPLMQSIENKVPRSFVTTLYRKLYSVLYLTYVHTEPYISQFQRNTKQCLNALTVISNMPCNELDIDKITTAFDL